MVAPDERVPLVGPGDGAPRPGYEYRKYIWSFFMIFIFAAVGVVGAMLMFTGAKEIAHSGRDGHLITDLDGLDNQTVLNVQDYDYLGDISDYEEAARRERGDDAESYAESAPRNAAERAVSVALDDSSPGRLASLSPPHGHR